MVIRLPCLGPRQDRIPRLQELGTKGKGRLITSRLPAKREERKAQAQDIVFKCILQGPNPFY